MSERASEKFDNIKSRIEKSFNPYITLRIDLPENVIKEHFFELEKNPDFVKAVKELAEKWISQTHTDNGIIS